MKHTYSITIDLRLVEALYRSMTQAGLPPDSSFSQMASEAIKYFIADRQTRVEQDTDAALGSIPSRLLPTSLRADTAISFESAIKKADTVNEFLEDII